MIGVQKESEQNHSNSYNRSPKVAHTFAPQMSSSPLRIVFFGTPDFAAAGLEALANSRHDVVGVVTAPDRPAGRGQQMKPSEVKVMAEGMGLPIAQPEKLRATEFLSQLDDWRADLFVVVAFRMLPEIVWSRPSRGTVNIHGSLLPDFRGAAPIQHAVVSGAKRTGVTSFFITRDIDTGALLLQQSILIGPNDTAGEVYVQLMKAGANLAVDTANALASEPLMGVPQSELLTGQERPAPKLFRQDGRVDWRQTTAQVADFIRGMTPFPGAWTTLNGATLKVKGTDVAPTEGHAPSGLNPGQCQVVGDQLWVGTNDSPIRLVNVQLAGKPFMPVEDVIRGYRYPIASLGTDGH